MTLTPPVDLKRDHVLGNPDAEMTLLQYGSYGCARCHAVHSIVEELRSGQLRNVAERSGRAQDAADGGGLESLRREGYM